MGGFIAILLLKFICNHLICSNAEGKLYTELDSIPQSEVGLLLGTTPLTRIGRRSNQFFKFRIFFSNFFILLNNIILIKVFRVSKSLFCTSAKI